MRGLAIALLVAGEGGALAKAAAAPAPIVVAGNCKVGDLTTTPSRRFRGLGGGTIDWGRSAPSRTASP